MCMSRARAVCWRNMRILAQTKVRGYVPFHVANTGCKRQIIKVEYLELQFEFWLSDSVN